MNDANPRWHHAEGGPDDERDPYAQDPYYQQQHYGYDAYGRPVQAPPPPQQQEYGDPYYGQGRPDGWIPQQSQPQQPYYGQDQGGRIPQQQGYDTGQHPLYDTGVQPPLYDTGRQAPVYDTGQQPPVYDTGQQAPVYDTGRQAPVYGTGGPTAYDTGVQSPVYDTGQHAGYDTGQHPAQDLRQGPASGAAPGAARVRDPEAPREYQTEQFSFVDEESEESEEVIDWLKFSESRTERREEAKRRGRNRKAGLVVVLVLALLGGAGYLWQAGKIPGLGKTKATATTAGGSQKRDVIVVHLLPVGGGPSSTALLVDNATKGRGTTVLIPNNVQLTGDDGNVTTLDKSVADGVGPTRDGLNTLLGTDIKGSWRLDTPYLELLVDSVGDIYVDTNATVKGTGKDSGKTLVAQGKQQDLTGQAAVAYATYRAPGESETDQLSRFGQVMQAVLKKMPSDAADATRTVQGLAQILDPSLTEKQLGASLAALAELAKTGAYDTAMLPVQKDGSLSTQATDSVVRDVLGGTVKTPTGAAAQPRVEIKDASGSAKSAAMAQAAIVNGGSYSYVPGGKATGTQSTSTISYADAAQLAAAKDVAATLGLPAGSVRKGTVPSNADILVVLGKDYTPQTSQ
ncbi:LytR C-terminal domain-containing protein [Actinacidiphila sp. DG2A-62]|uniref:LCP family protein n=1 Tax=Actinacidiphila sp. DG2A-62 TaxID=3108821 RepID=UPI002DBB54D9|nr:LytR C-terminal domain-containing protein [Actinacidiphila sp. DG2A-62]MEC3994200.1 LytR C-terminal domain-containing protein [Actinacidiphila sp. DG2A-62]